MTTKKNAKASKKPVEKPPVLFPSQASKPAQAQAEKTAGRIAAMSPAKLRKMIATSLAIEANRRPPHAGTEKATKSDLLALLNAIGAEFVRRYYPDATDASIHVMKYPPTPDMPIYSVSLPLAVPVAGKGGAA